MSERPTNELPVDTEQAGIAQIPHLAVETYGNQETFLIMLQSILNATIDMVNFLAQREHEREVREGKHMIIVAGPEGFQ